MSTIEAPRQVIDDGGSEEVVAEVPYFRFETHEEYCEYRDSYRSMRGQAVVVSARISHELKGINDVLFPVKLPDPNHFDITDCPAIIEAIAFNQIYIKITDEDGGVRIVGASPRRFAAVLAEVAE